MQDVLLDIDGVLRELDSAEHPYSKLTGDHRGAFARRTLSLESLRVMPGVSCRRDMGEEQISSIISQLQAEPDFIGNNPVVAAPLRNKSAYMIVDGHRRLVALQKLRDSSRITVEVNLLGRELSRIEAAALFLHRNWSTLKSSEIATGVDRLHASGMSREAISRTLGFAWQFAFHEPDILLSDPAIGA